MKKEEAEEFVKFFEAMYKRFRARYDAPIIVKEGGCDVSGFWLLAMIGSDKVYLVSYKKKPKAVTISAHTFHKSSDCVQFQIWRGDLRFCSGDNSNFENCGPRLVTINLTHRITPLVGGAKNLMDKLGKIPEITRELSDPTLNGISQSKRVNI